jgi:hypothetical protein
MSKTITLIFLCLVCTTVLFSQIDPFSDFKKKVTVEKSTNFYFAAVADSIEIVTHFDAACNPLNTIKSKWTLQEKKLFYQDKDSFSYKMVGNILRPASKTYFNWRFDRQEWENQTNYTFNYQNNNPFLVERITSTFNVSIKKWVKTAVEVFQLDKKGNTLAYENYSPYSTTKSLNYKVAYEYTSWGALTYLKRERPSNGDWRTDSLKTVEYDGKRNRTNTTLTTYKYDNLDNQLSENTQKDTVLLKYIDRLLTYKKTEGKYPSIDSFIYDAEKVLILIKSYNASFMGNIDTSQVNLTYYENLNGKSSLQKKVYRRIMTLYNHNTKKDTAYWITSYTNFYKQNALNQIESIKSVSSDPQVDYTVFYSSVLFNYCSEISAPTTDIREPLAFVISPNPTNQTLFIAIEGQNEIRSSIQIMDVLGNSVKWMSNEKGDIKEIDVSDFAAGIYFVKIQVGHKVGVKKFVVNR